MCSHEGNVIAIVLYVQYMHVRLPHIRMYAYASMYASTCASAACRRITLFIRKLTTYILGRIFMHGCVHTLVLHEIVFYLYYHSLLCALGHR